MSRSRPEILFPLFAELDALPGVGPKSVRHFQRLKVERPRDLLFLAPARVTDRRLRPSLAGVPDGETATVLVQVERHQPARRPGAPHRIAVQDEAGGFFLVYFRAREAQLRELLPEGETRVVSGKAETWEGTRQITHPDHVLRPDAAEGLPAFEPVYPGVEGLAPRSLAKAVAGALDLAPTLEEWIEPSLKALHGWPDWRAALDLLHRPADEAALARRPAARDRLAYDELLAHQIALALARETARRGAGRATRGDGRLRTEALAALPYAPTGAQTRAVAEITADMAAPERMNRLLQGDVGAGKTLVALLAMLAAAEAGGQAALMAPTEILARQHLESLAPLLSPLGIIPVLLTGRDKGAVRAEKLAAIASGAAPLVVGTHALFSQDVEFDDLRLAVVDEQHRFGVRQRMDLSAKGRRPDVLVMTATPIPRSLALASYGDMDLSVLDEKPPGRKPVDTALISAGRYDEVVARLAKAVAEGRRAYWVCPMVEESADTDLTAATERHAALAEALEAALTPSHGPGWGRAVTALVHGQLPPAEKDRAMAAFAAGDARVLVATTVIEVGVNVPEASIMVIEHADRFGLAQLHQLRGRVGRGADRSTCLLMYEPPLTEGARARLTVLRETEDGFRIAEEDLRLRGPGDLLGARQSGLPTFRLADLERDAALMAAASDDARLLLAQDPTLEGPRGRAARSLLWLMEADEAIRMLKAG
ncbi:MAG: ATP-dependent DNA helicase RecG [Pseudomonadota bacterium]